MSFPRHNDDPRYTKSGAIYVAAGAGLTKWLSGDVYTIKASRESTSGSLGVVEATVPPGGGPIAHVHTKTDETFYILSGELEFLDGARKFVAGAGDFVFVPRGIRHRFKNIGTNVTRMLFMFTPGGPEAVFAHGDEPQPGQLPAPWTPERFATPVLLKLNEEFATEILPE